MSQRLFDVVLFDIDNVLIDTRSSYLAAIQKTVETYLNRPGIVTPHDIDEFKLLGGFNDDWDCCYGMITFLETALQGKPVRFGDHRRYRLSIPELRKLIPERPLGIDGLHKRLAVLYERVEKPSYQKIEKIFQRVYLGKKIGTGLIKKERLIFPRSLLQKMSHLGMRLGIVTGRNRFEAEYALKRFGVLGWFNHLITIDIVRREEKKQDKILRKPNPWPILEAAKRFQRKNASLSFLYVGDLPDDVLAAKRAKKFIRIKSVAFTKYANDSKAILEELKKIKPDFFLKNPSDLLKILFRK